MNNIIELIDLKLITNVAIITLPILAGFMGYYIKHSLDKRTEQYSNITNERREHYLSFISLQLSTIEKIKSKESVNEKKIIKETYSFYKKYLLYASPKVVKAVGDYYQFLYNGDINNNENRGIEMFEHLGKVVKAMRKDLGLKNKGAGRSGLTYFRAMIIGFDQIN